jgi:hypothetical protein
MVDYGIDKYYQGLEKDLLKSFNSILFDYETNGFKMLVKYKDK